MTDHRARYGPHNPDDTYVAHGIAENLVDLGEVRKPSRHGARPALVGKRRGRSVCGRARSPGGNVA
jgi:hypothetical protein